METGPAVARQAGLKFDLVLTELTDGAHRFMVQAGSDLGRTLLAGLKTAPATEEDEAAARVLIRTAQKSMTRRLEARTAQLVLLGDAMESRQWQAVGARCMACTNCTMVCPTCLHQPGGWLQRGRHNGLAQARVGLLLHPELRHIHGGSVRATIPHGTANG